MGPQVGVSLYRNYNGSETPWIGNTRKEYIRKLLKAQNAWNRSERPCVHEILEIFDCVEEDVRIFRAAVRSERIVFVGARYKHVRCKNSKLRALYTRRSPAK